MFSSKLRVITITTTALLYIYCTFGGRKFSNDYFNIQEMMYSASNTAQLYDSKYVIDSFYVCEIDISKIREALVTAKPVKNGFIWKNPFLLVFSNGLQLQVSCYAHFYKIKKGGTYVISEKNANEFNDFISNTVNSKIVPWRKEKNRKGTH